MLLDSSGPSSIFHKQVLKNTCYTNRSIDTYKIWKAYDVFSHKGLLCILVSLSLFNIKDGFLVDSVFQGLLGILWIVQQNQMYCTMRFMTCENNWIQWCQGGGEKRKPVLRTSACFGASILTVFRSDTWKISYSHHIHLLENVHSKVSQS